VFGGISEQLRKPENSRFSFASGAGSYNFLSEVTTVIFREIKAQVQPGTHIPETRYRVKGIGTRRAEDALVYLIPNRKKPSSPYSKGITASEFERAYEHLNQNGDFSRGWFQLNMPDCDKDGPCQFLAIGGLFVLLGKASKQRGRYVLRSEPL
jgi:hypothetical protein